MKAPHIDIRIAATCAKCDYLEWKHFRYGDRWFCALYGEELYDGAGWPVTEIGKKEDCKQVFYCKQLVERYEALPEKDEEA